MKSRFLLVVVFKKLKLNLGFMIVVESFVLVILVDLFVVDVFGVDGIVLLGRDLIIVLFNIGGFGVIGFGVCVILLIFFFIWRLKFFIC